MPAIVIYVYNSQNDNFEKIKYSTESYIKHKCLDYISDIQTNQSFQDMKLVSGVFTKYQFEGKEYEKRFFLFRHSVVDKQVLVIFDARLGYFDLHLIDKSNIIYHLFKYYDIVISCGIKCTIDSPVVVITNNENEIQIRNETNLSLYNIMKCIDKLRPFKPFRFCKQKNFDQVITLGNDYFIQKGSHFWRYTDLQFEVHIKQTIVPNLRFDSDFTAFLERNGFGLYSDLVYL